SLAEMCRRYKQRYHDAALLFGKALAAEPKLGEDPGKLRRYNAARAAALAGCGHGKDVDKLDPEERGRLRRQALDWLLAHRAAWRLLLENKDKAGPPLRTEMQLWLDEVDFASVRGPEALAKLPKAEQAEWQQLWQDVAALRDRAAAASGPAKQS